jgi:hypothetical protein
MNDVLAGGFLSSAGTTGSFGWDVAGSTGVTAGATFSETAKNFGLSHWKNLTGWMAGVSVAIIAYAIINNTKPLINNLNPVGVSVEKKFSAAFESSKIPPTPNRHATIIHTEGMGNIFMITRPTSNPNPTIIPKTAIVLLSKAMGVLFVKAFIVGCPLKSQGKLMINLYTKNSFQ